jgi:hypothetical protein
LYRLIRVLPLLVPLGACGGSNCASEQDANTRDWCLYEQASDAAAKDDLHGAMGAIATIQDVSVRAAAADKLIMSAPTGLTSQGAGDICQTLPEPQSSNCIRTWSRPHLWGE